MLTIPSSRRLPDRPAPECGRDLLQMLRRSLAEKSQRAQQLPVNPRTVEMHV